LIELLRFLNPERVRIEKAIATWPNGVDASFVADLPIPYENGGAENVRRAAREYDVLLSWGVRLDELLNGERPPLSVFIAHGDGDYTQELLDGSAHHVDHIVAVSNRVLRQCSCNGTPTTVIYNGVDTSRLARTQSRDEVRQSFGFGQDDFVLGYVGRLADEKRPQTILKAVAGLPPQFKLLMVGWGRLLPNLMQAANRLIPGRYAFVTATNYLGDYYEAMDAFCLLGVEEGFSLAMLEAMMCARPIVATAVGAVPELIVDRVNGLIVEPTAEAVRAAARQLHCYPIWARGVGAEGKAYADRYGHAARMARDYEELLWRLWREKYGKAPLS
jgi:glycosyltransferase involved in cell wall biosynthesis